ncbi:unnamed protein product [Adineta steineri]|uniref:Uncharacterized protein n=1 Tax=Adineta steineri TaxID=433720 RepID=A0A813QUE1_9BILA|nr:unnamed protein product [Adineta steineri]CAF0934111.1 unnamed protein product [Adineta steineri]CAF1214177.1 unnamed protein product [Adineta steineri]
MLGSILKFTLSFSVLFLFITLLWQSSIADALPVLATDYNMDKSNDDAAHLMAADSFTGAPAIKHSFHTGVNQPMLIDRFHSLSPKRYFKKKPHSNNKKFSSNLFQSTGTHHNQNGRANKRMKAAIDNRLKRFRMLDQDEFQEMLKSMSQQTTDEQSKASNGMDAIGGMQLASMFNQLF